MQYHFKYFKWFLENAEEALADKITYQDENTLHRIVFEPIGVAAVIVPWNFPFVNVIWGTIPNLLAGNPVVFKHSEECPLVGKLCEEIILSADLLEGVFSEVYGDGTVGRLLVEQDIDLIWFTGSSETGKLLYETASKKFIKAVLEMGGSNPAIIFEDMDANYLLLFLVGQIGFRPFQGSILRETMKRIMLEILWPQSRRNIGRLTLTLLIFDRINNRWVGQKRGRHRFSPEIIGHTI